MKSHNTITVTIYTNRDGIEWTFPARWQICCGCEGRATTSRHVECDGGGFTSSEWAEQDEDFRRDYLRGSYDRPCPDCNGLGRVQTVDRKSVTSWRDKIALKAYFAQERDNAEIDAMHAAERRMGA